MTTYPAILCHCCKTTEVSNSELLYRWSFPDARVNLLPISLNLQAPPWRWHLCRWATSQWCPPTTRSTPRSSRSPTSRLRQPGEGVSTVHWPLFITHLSISGIKCTPCSLFLARLRTFASTRPSGQCQNCLLSNSLKTFDVCFLFRDASVSIQSRCCYLKFLDEGVLPISLHMTNTVFIDRAIIVQVNFRQNCENQSQISDEKSIAIIYT